MNTYWDNNRDAMIWWMNRALTGFRGLVRDARNNAPSECHGNGQRR